jgi:hypothetical protein
VVDDLLARKAFHGQSAVGRRILIRVRSPQPEWVQIVGVVAHQRESSLTEVGREQVYFTDAFVGSGATNFWTIRTRNDPANYANAVSAAVRAVDSQVVVNEIQTGDALMEKAQAGTRFSLLLIGVFAIVAGVLAGVGLYGVLATTVRHRTAEIGVRMALGAEPARVFQLVVTQGFRLSVIGIACGLVAALGLTQLMKAMLVGVRASDPITYVVMVLLFLAIAARGVRAVLFSKRTAEVYRASAPEIFFVSILLSPFQGLLISDVYPGLAPWAAFFRRYAAAAQIFPLTCILTNSRQIRTLAQLSRGVQFCALGRGLDL